MTVSFAEMVRIERARKRMSQTALAQAAGCSRNYISVIERGQAGNVTMAMVLAIVAALDMNMTVKFEPKPAQGAE